MKLAVRGMGKTYSNGVKAMDDISFEFEGGMLGLLGPNGAGKSTLMRTLSTLQQCDKGSMLFNGIDISQDPMSLRRVLGYLPQNFGVYPDISAEKLLNYFARLKGISSKSDRYKVVDRMLDLTNLQEVRKLSVSSFSGGMRQRFGIAQCLINEPDLVIVDEPLAGLDPGERKRFLQVIRGVAQESVVLFSTHIVDDVKDLCKEVAVINNGKLLLKKSPSEAIRELEGNIWKCIVGLDQIEQVENDFQLLGSNYVSSEEVTVRIYAQSRPGDQWESCHPIFEDVYFKTLKSKSSC